MVVNPNERIAYQIMYIKFPKFNNDETVFGIYHNDNRQWHV